MLVETTPTPTLRSIDAPPPPLALDASDGQVTPAASDMRREEMRETLESSPAIGNLLESCNLEVDDLLWRAKPTNGKKPPRRAARGRASRRRLVDEIFVKPAAKKSCKIEAVTAFRRRRRGSATASDTGRRPPFPSFDSQ
ncbi:hypothetical protein JL721_10034 [Aureococcus anophagefferens]|nr:hypothetical protein JL721_10034 [Aureococcus anophagefferens]